MLIQEMMTELAAFAPLELAESWDNVGLVFGDPKAELERAMTCLTITDSIVQEAIAERVQLIISHHPVLFKPVQRITTETTEGKLLWQLARASVAIYSVHTAYDNCAGGINDQLSHRLGLVEVRPLAPAPAQPRVKIVVFVPEGDVQPVSDALFEAGAGRIGQYRECGFRVAGTGTFFGEEGANPSIGQKGRREDVAEYRLEVVCPQPAAAAAIAAMRRVHSYEEPAFDVYPLQGPAGSGGAGRIGNLTRPVTAEALARQIGSALGVKSLTLTGARERSDIQRVAVACGAGGSLLPAAIAARADAFLTGEVRFHDELAAQAASVAVVAAGHYATERRGVEALAERLAQRFPQVRIWASRNEQDPARAILSAGGGGVP